MSIRFAIVDPRMAALGGLSAARDDLIKIVDAIPGINAQGFVTSMEATVSDAATKAVKPWIYKGMAVNLGLLVLGLWLGRRK